MNSRDAAVGARSRATPVIPWERTDRPSFVGALFESLWRIVRSPRAAFATIPTGGGAREPFLFALSVSVVAGLLGGLVETIAQLVAPPGVGPSIQPFGLSIGETSLDWLAVPFASLGGCLLGLVVGAPIFLILFPVLLTVWAALLHLCAWLCGALRASGGFETSFRVVCYATPAFLAGAVPIAGDFLVLAWLGALQGIGLWRLHDAPAKRALAAVALPIATLLLLSVALWAGARWLGS